MTRIDFYISQATDEQTRLLVALRLCEKAYARDMGVMIWAASAKQAETMDTLLWTHKPETFLPHCSLDAPMPNTPIVISSGQDDLSHHGLIINLGLSVPNHFSRFQRLAEVVIQQEPVLQATRANYAFYKQRGYPIHTHQL